ncbi:hypothetical protein [Empedobacter sp. GD03739]|uniref:hypothetical protein n=1 Tax=Empedobacter sp. GD03739 TaxID=2975376 RepID=UPI002449FD09|nr:hypothetical protein [Empedobacter sp. GD03739]MDH1602555.1 hypothetical protein [Empedobacter sp. GD03739]
MNRVNYDQTEGFPLDVNILDFGQKANQITQQLGEIIAPLAIIKGCVQNGNNVSDGIVCINGEMLPFKGGLKQDVVRIVETAENRVFENGSSKPVLITRYATFGAGADFGYAWGQFHRGLTIKKIEEKLNDKTDFNKLVERVNKLEVFARPFSSGFGAVLFLRPAAEIPEGWEEVTDLRGRMPIGQNPDDANLSSVLENFLGGSKTKAIYKSNLPAEGVAYKDAYYIENATNGGLDGTIYVGENKFGSNKSDNDNNRLFYRNATTDNLGNGVELDVMNPYRIVIFIKPKQ